MSVPVNCNFAAESAEYAEYAKYAEYLPIVSLIERPKIYDL